MGIHLFRPRLAVGMTLIAIVLLTAAGCAPYRLQGFVVAGDQPGVEVLGKNDPKLEELGPMVPGVGIEVLLDPHRLSPKKIGRGDTDADGAFAIQIDESGAGLLILDIELIATRDGFASVRERLELPSASKRVVVTIQRGEDRPSFEAGNILEDTLRDAEPYLRE